MMKEATTRCLFTAIVTITGAVACAAGVFAADVLLLHPGSADAGHLGILGTFIGLPGGFAACWLQSKCRKTA